MGLGNPSPSHSHFPCLTCSLEPPKKARSSEVDPRKATTARHMAGQVHMAPILKT